MSNCYREHSLWVFLSMTSTLHAFMRAFINAPSETYPAYSEIDIQKNHIIILKCSFKVQIQANLISTVLQCPKSKIWRYIITIDSPSKNKLKNDILLIHLLLGKLSDILRRRHFTRVQKQTRKKGCGIVLVYDSGKLSSRDWGCCCCHGCPYCVSSDVSQQFGSCRFDSSLLTHDKRPAVYSAGLAPFSLSLSLLALHSFLFFTYDTCLSGPVERIWEISLSPAGTV